LHEIGTVVKDATECADKLKEEYKHIRVNGPYICTEKGTATLCVMSSALAIRMNRAVGEYSGSKRLYGEVFSQPIERLAHFVATYLDGDGTCPVYTRPNGYVEDRYTCGTKSKTLALDLQWILGKLGCPATLCPSLTYPGEFYHLSFSNLNGMFLAGKAVKHRQTDPEQMKEHSFIWNGYVCRPVRENHIAEVAMEVFNLEVEEDHSYTVYNGIAVKNCNRNGDGFNEKYAEIEIPEPAKGVSKIVKLADGLTKYHSTFVKSGGYVYKHHKNTDPKLSIGRIVAEAYNPEMQRGELVIKVAEDHPDWRSDLHSLANGKDLPFSMSCKIAKDLCSYCGNRSRSRMEYCDHLREHMGEILKSGHQVCAHNDDPYFFDISKVIKPADRIAWSFRKVADAFACKGGAALAEEEGLTLPAWMLENESVPVSKQYLRKWAVARKLAEIEKVIDGIVRSDDNPQLKKCLGCPADLPSSEMEKLRKAKLCEALEGLGSAQICLSLRDFFNLVLGDEANKHKDDIEEAEESLPNLFGRLEDRGELQECANDSSYDTEGGAIPGFVRDIVEKLAGSHSLGAEPTRRRVTIAIIRGHSLPEKRAGYAGQSKRADYLAKEYAKYLLSFGLQAERNDEGKELTLLRNRFRF
jgi:hypothetical protein